MIDLLVLTTLMLVMMDLVLTMMMMVVVLIPVKILTQIQKKVVVIIDIKYALDYETDILDSDSESEPLFAGALVTTEAAWQAILEFHINH